MKKLQKIKTFELLDALLKKRSSFSIGESILIRASALKASSTYSIQIRERKKQLLESTFITDREGNIPATVFWAQFGLDDPFSTEVFTIKEALERWQQSNFTVTLLYKKEPVAKLKFSVNEKFEHPLVLASDKKGRLLNGFEQDSKEILHLTFAGLPKASTFRVMMVRRQNDWNVRNNFEVAEFASGAIASQDVELSPRRRIQTIRFANSSNILPGAYDFIVRPIRYGHEDNDAPFVIPRDIIASRLNTGLVVREDFWTAKPVLGGCVNKLPISGRSISGSPYFRYSDTFEVGEDIYGALDPGIVDPGNISKMCALYVIPSKTSTQWNTNNSLNHLPVLGGNSNVQKFKVQAGCINMNKRLLWSNATQIGEYDIVADFGNNVPNLSSFIPDNAYDTPLDIIDGYFVAGFRVVNDPGTMSDFTHIGNWNYTEGTQGTATVQDELTHYHTPGGFSTTNVTVNRRAHVYFPADVAGVTNPAQISTAKADYPLIVIIHGNGHNYVSYDFLLQHFAKNGFIAASIHLNGGMRGLGRANMFFEHHAILQSAFGSNMQNNIGIMGHSRGGEAVLKVARINAVQSLGLNVNAVIALGPTDQYGSEALSGGHSTPYFVLYGARDGDINGGIWTPGYTVPQTGFAQYDRSEGAVKSMAFVYKATHNGFITTNSDATWAGENPANLLTAAVQKTITKAYMNAFFRQHLLGESIWRGIFTGEWKPASVEQTGAELYIQYKDTGGKIIDDFEGATNNWQLSSIGGTVTDNSTLPVNPEENRFHDHAPSSTAGLDNRSPHDSKGLKIRWNNANDELVFNIPGAHKDVSTFSYLSFRVTQKEASPFNNFNQAQKMRVALKDGGNKERAIRVSTVSTIPFPDQRVQANYRKSAMHTVRIPLTSYTIVCAGQDQVDLSDVVSLAFKFSPNASGEIEIDSVEFTH